MENRNKEIESKYDATWLALNMYDSFVKELITYMRNTKKHYDMTILNTITSCSIDREQLSYLKGVRDTFERIVEIVVKEYGLAKSDIVYAYKMKDDKKSIFEENTWKYVSDLQHKKIKQQKNDEVDKLFPDNKYRGRGNWEKFFRMKGCIADLIEYYGVEGFRMGMLCEKMLRETKFKELPKNPISEEFIKNTEMVEYINKELKFEEPKNDEDFTNIVSHGL